MLPLPCTQQPRTLWQLTSYLLTVITFICGVLGCSDELSLEEKIDELWSNIIDYEGDNDEKVVEWCRELERLTRKQPTLFADYLIGANAIASTRSQTYTDWRRPLSTGLLDLQKYGKDLSAANIFYTRVLILYEDARLHDSKGIVGLAEAKYERVWESLPLHHPDSGRLSAFRNALPIALAQLHLFTGNYKKAEYWLDQLGEQLDLKDDTYPGLAFSTKAQVEQAKGNDSLVIEYYETAITYFLENNPKIKPGHYMETCMNYAEFLRQRGAYDRALEVIYKASKQNLKGERHAIYRAYQLAKIYLSQGKLDEAFQEITQALILSKKVTADEYYWHAKILAVQAEIELAQHKWQRSASTAQKGLDQLNAADLSEDIQTSPDPREIESKLDALPLLVTKARALSSGFHDGVMPFTQQLELALQTFLRAIELIQILRAEYEDDEVKEFLSSSSFALFEPAIAVAYHLYKESGKERYLQQGLKIAETSRSLSLLENIKGQQAQSILGIPEKILEEENSLKYQISKLENELKVAPDLSWKIEQRQLLSERREAYQLWQEKIREDYPTYYQLKYQEEPIDLPELKSSLAYDEAILSFFWGDDHLYAILLSKERSVFHRIPQTGDLVAAIEAFKKEISSSRGGNSTARLTKLINSGHAIYNLILKPFDQLPEKLLLVSDGPLHDIPFAALPKTNITTQFPREIPYLIKEHTVKRIFSVAVWARHFRTKKSRSKFSTASGIDSLLVLAPVKFPDDSQLSLDSVKLQEVFGEKVELVREVNTEKARTLLKRNYKYVLIFSHASAKDGRPYIQLSSDSLYLEEIYHTDMETQLIVLGACESGLGTDRKGEGILSLGRAFIYQDIPNAAMTLWRVRDASALNITQTLLQQHIQNKLDPAEALRNAQLALLGSSETNALPYQWAGFVTVGQ